MTNKKICQYCGYIKPVEDFYAKADTNDGFQPWCVTCMIEYNKKYRQKKKEENFRKNFVVTEGVVKNMTFSEVVKTMKEYSATIEKQRELILELTAQLHGSDTLRVAR